MARLVVKLPIVVNDEYLVAVLGVDSTGRLQTTAAAGCTPDN